TPLSNYRPGHLALISALLSPVFAPLFRVLRFAFRVSVPVEIPPAFTHNTPFYFSTNSFTQDAVNDRHSQTRGHRRSRQGHRLPDRSSWAAGSSFPRTVSDRDRRRGRRGQNRRGASEVDQRG